VRHSEALTCSHSPTPAAPARLPRRGALAVLAPAPLHLRPHGPVLVLPAPAQYVYLAPKQLVFPIRTSGGKPVQGHWPVAVN
jgi:hypothetical protein